MAREFSEAYLEQRTKKLEERKRRWLELCAQNPALSRAQLRAKDQTLYTALYISDPEWLKRHFPGRQWGSGGNKADWAARDKNLLGRLQAQCDRMKSSSEFPCRISADAFERAMAGEKLYAYRLKHMPLSAGFIKKVAESANAFAIRCVSFAARHLRAEGKVLIPEELRVRAKISALRAAAPEVKALIHDLCSGSDNRSPK